MASKKRRLNSSDAQSVENTFYVAWDGPVISDVLKSIFQAQPANRRNASLLPSFAIRACRLVCKKWCSIASMPRAFIDGSALKDFSRHESLANVLAFSQHVSWRELELFEAGEKHFMLDAISRNFTISSLDIVSSPVYFDNASWIALLEWIGRAPSLQSLKLISCQLDDDTLEPLLAAVSKNTSIKHLDLGGNCFQLTHNCATLLCNNSSLTDLSFRERSLRLLKPDNMARILKTNTTLKRLDLSQMICSGGGMALVDALGSNTTLEELLLVEATFDKLSNLGSSLNQMRSLKKLDVAGVVLDDDELVVSDCLAVTTSLRHLSVGSNSFSAETLQLLCESLETNTSLVSLDLNMSSLDHDTGRTLGEAISRNKTLEHLSILDDDLCEHITEALAQMLSANSSLTSFEMVDQCISFPGPLKTLAEALRVNNTLEKLVLYCENSSSCISPLAEAIQTNKSIKELDIFFEGCSHNQELLAFTQALKANTSIKSLVFRSREFGEDAAKAFAELLASTTTLESLSFRIEDDDVDALISIICEGLKKNHSLTYLKLSASGIEDFGAVSLANMWKENNTILHLDATENSVEKTGLLAFAEMCLSNPYRRVDFCQSIWTEYDEICGY